MICNLRRTFCANGMHPRCVPEVRGQRRMPRHTLILAWHPADVVNTRPSPSGAVTLERSFGSLASALAQAMKLPNRTGNVLAFARPVMSLWLDNYTLFNCCFVSQIDANLRLLRYVLHSSTLSVQSAKRILNSQYDLNPISFILLLTG